jgi:tight adherence protein B
MLTPPMIMMAGGAFVTLLLLVAAFSGPSTAKAQTRRLSSIKGRHAGGDALIEAQMRRVISNRPNGRSAFATQYLPNPAMLQKRLKMTGKNWTYNRYMMACGGIAALVIIGVLTKGGPVLLAVLLGLALGLILPHWTVSLLISRRIGAFTARFPDAIELMVRGLRSGLPISETLAVVATELPGPVGQEFRMVVDQIKIGRTMDEALQILLHHAGHSARNGR